MAGFAFVGVVAAVVERSLRREGALQPGELLAEVHAGRVLSMVLDDEPISLGSEASFGGRALPRRRNSSLCYCPRWLMIRAAGGSVVSMFVDLIELQEEPEEVLLLSLAGGLSVRWKMASTGLNELIDRIVAQWEAVVAALTPEEFVQRAVNIGAFRESRGDLDGARQVWLGGLESADADTVAGCALNLGRVSRRAGDAVLARDYYTIALEAGASARVPAALLGLAHTRQDDGDLASAQHLYQQAVEATGDTTMAAQARTSLALLLIDRGDLTEAAGQLQTVADSDHLGYAQDAAHRLGVLFESQGNTAQAVAAFRRALDINRPKGAARAAVKLGINLEELGDIPAAITAYIRATQIEPTSHATALASACLGRLLAETQGARAATPALQRAIKSGYPDAAALATETLDSLQQRPNRT